MIDSQKKYEILIVEDNPADARLVKEAFKESTAFKNISVVEDGEEALKFLYREDQYTDVPRPHLIMLDLNLPKKSGLEVLQVIKQDGQLRCIPVIILTASHSKNDINRTYNAHANCYVTKPLDFDEFVRVLSIIDKFWLSAVCLPFD